MVMGQSSMKHDSSYQWILHLCVLEPHVQQHPEEDVNSVMLPWMLRLRYSRCPALCMHDDPRAGSALDQEHPYL